MKISVVTVCYNSDRTLEETILSIAGQNYKNKEHIIVDGGSTDQTQEILSRYSGLIKWISEPDQGIYDAMNKGIGLATGDVIGTLNADDVYINSSILDQVAKVFSEPMVEACFADLVYVNQYDTRKIVRYWRSKPFKSGLFKTGWMPAHPTFFVRREIYQQYGNFDLSFPRQADFELTMRFLEIAKITSVYIPNIWVKMRMGGISNNSMSGIFKGNIEALNACRKNSLDVWGLVFVARKLLSRLPQFINKPDKHVIN